MTLNTPSLDLPRIQPAQAQKHVTHNEAIEILDAVAQLSVLARDVNTPPAAASDGDIYALGDAPTGVWAGQAGLIAAHSQGGWLFVTPNEGWRLWDIDAQDFYVLKAGVWTSIAANLENVDGVGIRTTSDDTNRLAVASPAVILTHDDTSGNHQLKVNKSTLSDTASLLFQTGWSGRAEMGTTGSDDFAIKVSADGATFTTALSFDAATGFASGQAIQQSADDTTAGRLMRADFGYGPGNLVGTVSEADGLPTGAAIEGSQTNLGDYVRFADGTQICSDAVMLEYVAANRLEITWTYPVPFSSNPLSVSASIHANSFLAGATPDLDEIGAPLHANSTSTQLKIILCRNAGQTNFELGDTCLCRITAVGRWF